MEALEKLLQKTRTSLEFNIILEQIAEKAVSDMGKERALSILPADSPDTVKMRLAFAKETKALIENVGSIPIYGLSDVECILKKGGVKGAAYSVEEILELSKNTDTANSMRKFASLNKLDYPQVYTRLRYLEDLSVFSKIVKSKIKEDGTIEDNATPELKQIRNEIRKHAGRLRKRLGQILNTAAQKGYTQEDLITIKEGRFVIPLKDEYRREVKGIIHHKSASGQTAFVEPLEIYEMNNALTSLEIEESREIHKILQELTEYAWNQRMRFVSNQQILSDFDCELAKGYYARSINAEQPDIARERKLFLMSARHPLLIKRIGFDNVVPLDLELGGEFNTLVITGPNSGGKTVALKTLGLLSLMVQSGILVPAHPDSAFPVFANVFADIGDAQSIQDNLSTFSSHLRNLKTVIDCVTENDLVLFDEIGTGTDPRAGAVLAIAIFEQLCSVGCMTLATTHHGELKVFAQKHEKIENASMAFDLDTLESTYKLRMRIPGSSYAIEISRRLGLQESLVKRAAELMGKEELQMESLIKDLREKVEQLEKELRSSTLKRVEYEGLIKLYRKEMDALTKEKKSLKKEAAETLRNLIDGANKRIEHAVLEIRQSTASKESIRQSKQTLSQQREKLKKLEKEAYSSEKKQPVPELAPGDEVYLPEYREKGKVITAPQKDGRVRVDINGILLLIDVAKVEKNEAPEKSEQVVIETTPVIHVDPEVDIRGMYGDEAVETVKEYLNDVVVANLKKITIIHGKGKGILQKRIHAYLPKDKRIASFRIGAWGEGDTGVTIVEMK